MEGRHCVADVAIRFGSTVARLSWLLKAPKDTMNTRDHACDRLQLVAEAAGRKHGRDGGDDLLASSARVNPLKTGPFPLT